MGMEIDDKIVNGNGKEWEKLAWEWEWPLFPWKQISIGGCSIRLIFCLENNKQAYCFIVKFK